MAPLTEGLSVLRTEMNFSWNRLQLTGALEGSDYRIIFTSTVKALAYKINRSMSLSIQQFWQFSLRPLQLKKLSTCKTAVSLIATGLFSDSSHVIAKFVVQLRLISFVGFKALSNCPRLKA